MTTATGGTTTPSASSGAASTAGGKTGGAASTGSAASTGGMTGSPAPVTTFAVAMKMKTTTDGGAYSSPITGGQYDYTFNGTPIPAGGLTITVGTTYTFNPNLDSNSTLWVVASGPAGGNMTDIPLLTLSGTTSATYTPSMAGTVYVVCNNPQRTYAGGQLNLVAAASTSSTGGLPPLPNSASTAAVSVVAAFLAAVVAVFATRQL
jgi:hypothetical protein